MYVYYYLWNKKQKCKKKYYSSISHNPIPIYLEMKVTGINIR